MFLNITVHINYFTRGDLPLHQIQAMNKIAHFLFSFVTM